MTSEPSETTTEVTDMGELIRKIFQKILVEGGEGGMANQIEAVGGKGGKVEILF